jgi:RNA polymerase sigma-70 factor (ECF subfamily)
MQEGTGLPGSNEAAFAAFYRRHVMTLLNYIRRYAPTGEDAEDVLVEVFLAAHEQRVLVTLSEDEQLAWLRRVAYHKCVDLLRHQQRHPSLALETVSETLYEPEEQSPESLALRADEQTLLRHHLAELPAPQQAILSLKFGQRLSGAEIARRLNRSESSVSTLLARALNYLRERYRSKKGDCTDE